MPVILTCPDCGIGFIENSKEPHKCPTKYNNPAPLPDPPRRLMDAVREQMPDITKDSGERRHFDTGSQRDVRTGKGRYDLLPPMVIKRLAQLYERGAKKYDDNNWKLGQPLSVFMDSCLRHAFQVLDGKTDEDHAAAVMWNIAGYMWTKDAIANGMLPLELDDMDAPNG